MIIIFFLIIASNDKSLNIIFRYIDKKAFHIIIQKLFLKWQVLAFSINDQNIFLYVDFDKQSEIIIDVWIFDSMINKNFNCLWKSHFHAYGA